MKTSLVSIIQTHFQLALDIISDIFDNYQIPVFDTKLLNTTNINCVQNIRRIYAIHSVLHFGDQRNENRLLFDLCQLRQSNNESALIIGIHKMY